jgi:PAS domain S-box-containing protein
MGPQADDMKRPTIGRLNLEAATFSWYNRPDDAVARRDRALTEERPGVSRQERKTAPLSLRSARSALAPDAADPGMLPGSSLPLTGDAPGVSRARSVVRAVAEAIALPVLVGLAYYIGARIGFVFQSPATPQSVMWLPNSILLAVLLLIPVRRWPGCLAAALPAQLLVGWESHSPMLPMSLLFLTNCGDAMLGAALVRHFACGRGRHVAGLQCMLIFFAFGAVLSPLVVSFADAGITVLTHWSANYWTAYFTRVRANVLTNVILVPTIVGAVRIARSDIRSLPKLRVAEGVALFAGLAVVATIVFATEEGTEALPMLYVPLTFLLWAAVRFSPGVTGASLFLVAVVSSWNALHGAGAFSSQQPSENVFELQVFLLATSVPLLCLAAVVRERVNTAAALRTSEAAARAQFVQLAAVYRTAPVGLTFIDRDLRYVSINDRLAEMHGVPVVAHIGFSVREVIPALADAVEPLLRRTIDTGVPILDHEISAQNTWGGSGAGPGSTRVWLCHYYPVKDESGDVVGVNAVVQEITEQKRAEEQLRNSQDALQASFERIQDLAARLISAQEAERTRIARELHDDVNQQLAAISISLSNLKRRLPDDTGEVRLEVDRLQHRTASLLEAIRHLSHELHSSVLHHAGLVAAMRSVCSELGRKHAIDITFLAADDIGEVPDDVSLCLYRVTQEALRNVATHSGARQVEVALERRDRELDLTVADNGRGLDFDDARRSGGLGLISIDERVRLARGSVHVESEPQRGTRLRVRVPLGGGYGTSEGVAGG